MENKNNKQDSSKKWIQNMLVLAIIATIIFIGFAIWTGIKINDDQVCSVDRFYVGDEIELVNSTHILNTSNNAVLQELVLEEEYLNYKFCFYLATTTDNQISVVDVSNHTLATIYITNNTQRYCTYIDGQYLEGINFIGLRCDTCSNNTAMILKELIGEDINQITTDFSEDITFFEGETLSYKLFAYSDCKGQLKFFLGMYFAFLSCLAVMTLILVGYDYLRDLVFKGWD